MLAKVNASLFCQLITMPLFERHRIICQVAGHDSLVVKLIPPLVLTDADRIWIRDAFAAVIADWRAHSRRDLGHRPQAGRPCDASPRRLSLPGAFASIVAARGRLAAGSLRRERRTGPASTRITNFSSFGQDLDRSESPCLLSTGPSLLPVDTETWRLDMTDKFPLSQPVAETGRASPPQLCSAPPC